MAYRTFDNKPHPPRRTMQNTATPSKVYVHNGTTSNLAIPCWYQEVHSPIRMRHHNRSRHDHIGWPDPRRIDGSCQLYEPFEAGYCNEPIHTAMGGHPPVKRLLDMRRLIPIHLKSEYENYTSASVAWVDTPKGITATATIDDDQDWIVRVKFVVQDTTATTDPSKYRFSVFVSSDRGKDLVSLAELVVLPSAY